MKASEIAIVGAGMSGLTAARRLAAAGARVRVFDKARGPGGRMSTRRTAEANFDHGAQYFTARTPSFMAAVEGWRQQGVVREWHGRIVALAAGSCSATARSTHRFVGVPRMSALTRRLAADLDIITGFRAVSLGRHGNRWQITADDGRCVGPFDTVVLALPAPQVPPIVAGAAAALSARAAAVEFAPCWAVMLAFAEPLTLPYDAAFVAADALSWIARNSSKPQRDAGEAWVLHAGTEWSSAHLQVHADVVITLLRESFARVNGGVDLPVPVAATAHLWRFALPPEPLAEACLWDPSLRIGACGDWCGGPRVEGAFHSGVALADRIH